MSSNSRKYLGWKSLGAALALLALFCFLFPSFGYAEEDPPEVKDIEEGQGEFDSTPVENSGAISVVVAAALETAGYKMQSIVLHDLGQMIKSFGMLLYIGAAMVTIVLFVVFYRFENMAWFLIGPPLFYFAVF